MNGMAARFGDLGPRLVSGLVLAAVGVLALWAGGLWFGALVSLGAGLIMAEIAGLLGRGGDAPLGPGPGRLRAGALGAVAAGGMMAALVLGGAIAPPLLVVAPALAALLLPEARLRALAYGLAVLLGAWMVARLRIDFGALWALWLILVVVASDVAGYFAGKAIGGARLWPAISPGKTWSGTVAGWAGAALVGGVFALPLGAGAALVPVWVVVAMAGQAGDLAQSALKRRVGAKDSSHLIPGHGGVYDRFDALVGAGFAVLLLLLAGLIPPGL
ncbi:MAG: phosphatidate cytidylyltransferase [Rhodobacteraceae bacterium]|nr:phosphatidate cytidylyltransferase [Paracoccaceae bacterium]